MTVWCDGIPLHSIKPCQMINSIEWKASQMNQGDQEEMVNGCNLPDENLKHQVSLSSDEDSMYIKLNGSKLQEINQLWENRNRKNQNQDKRNPYLWHILDSIVCKDISQKMYHMNDSFDKASKVNVMQDLYFRSRRYPLFRSLSLDVLDTASHGKIVTENWLSCNGRALQLMCLHDPSTGLAKSKYNLARQKVPMCTMDDLGRMECKDYIPWRDTDVSYMLVHSNPKLKRPMGDKPEFANEWEFNCEK